MKKLHNILITPKSKASAQTRSSNRINYQDKVLVPDKDISKRSVSNDSKQRKEIFSQNISENLSETSIILSLVEYSRLRERI